jgi:hypothetical protein
MSYERAMRVIRVFTTASPLGRCTNVKCLPVGRQANLINTGGSIQAHIAFRVPYQGEN